MPTYDYECTSCGHTFDAFQSITADPIRQCPKCRRRKVQRLIGSGSGILFKGSGFYTTDYRSKEYKDKAKADTSTSSSETKDKKSSDTKAPAGKKDTSKGSAKKGGTTKD